MQYHITLTVVVDADHVADVDDDAIGQAVMHCPGVVAVHGHSVHEAEDRPTDAQLLKVAQQMRGGRQRAVLTAATPAFGLPDGYIVAEFDGGQTVKGGFTLGISPEGEGSS